MEFIKNIAGKGAVGWKVILAIIAILLIAFGYYGYMYVPSQSSSFGGASCLISGTSSTFGYQSGPCPYSFEALIIGILLLVVVIAITALRR
jgi:hypothetical protein